MRTKLLCGSFLLLTSMLVQAGPILVVGTPADDLLATPVGPSPKLGGILINFDGLTPFATFSTYTSSGVSISSPDGIEVLPYSTQSGPNEMFDDSAAGSANLSITFSGSTQIGVGIADSDMTAGGAPVTIFLQALNSSGVGFGTLFSVTIPETGPNPGNGYFVIEDTIPDVYGVQITQPVSNAALYSGLAIDDVQVTPEPSTFLLLGIGAAILGFFRLRKQA